MTLQKDDQEITVPVQASVDGDKPSKSDVERAIHEKLQADPTELFVHGDTVILKVHNFGK